MPLATSEKREPLFSHFPTPFVCRFVPFTTSFEFDGCLVKRQRFSLPTEQSEKPERENEAPSKLPAPNRCGRGRPSLPEDCCERMRVGSARPSNPQLQPSNETFLGFPRKKKDKNKQNL